MRVHHFSNKNLFTVSLTGRIRLKRLVSCTRGARRFWCFLVILMVRWMELFSFSLNNRSMTCVVFSFLFLGGEGIMIHSPNMFSKFCDRDKNNVWNALDFWCFFPEMLVWNKWIDQLTSFLVNFELDFVLFEQIVLYNREKMRFFSFLVCFCCLFVLRNENKFAWCVFVCVCVKKFPNVMGRKCWTDDCQLIYC